MIPIDYHIFQRGWNHQPVKNWVYVNPLMSSSMASWKIHYFWRFSWVYWVILFNQTWQWQHNYSRLDQDPDRDDVTKKHAVKEGLKKHEKIHPNKIDGCWLFRTGIDFEPFRILFAVIWTNILWAYYEHILNLDQVLTLGDGPQCGSLFTSYPVVGKTLNWMGYLFIYVYEYIYICICKYIYIYIYTYHSLIRFQECIIFL